MRGSDFLGPSSAFVRQLELEWDLSSPHNAIHKCCTKDSSRALNNYRYIENQLKTNAGEKMAIKDEEDARKYLISEAAIFSIPEHIRQSANQRSD